MDSANFEEIITCGICLETFNEGSKCPRMLLCGHSFCHSCLDKLLAQSPSCPTCKTNIQFGKSELIPINFSLKSLIEIRSRLSICNISNVDDLENESSASQDSKSQSGSRSGKYLSEGYCDEHDTYRGLRCMNHEMWICGMCSTLDHRHCRTLLVAEAYKELKKISAVKVENELRERNAFNDRLCQSLWMLGEERRYLTELIKRKELELQYSTIFIAECEHYKANNLGFCDKFKQLLAIIQDSADEHFSKAINELDKLLQERKLQIPEGIQYFDLPQTRKALEALCDDESVFVVEDRFDGVKRYGLVEVDDDGRIFVESFEHYGFNDEVPVGRIFNFRELLFKFTGSTELPNTAFLTLSPEDTTDKDFTIVIETKGFSQRVTNFILLCSALKGPCYKGRTIEGFEFFYKMFSGPHPVVEGIRNESKTPVVEGGVYGIMDHDSGFRIQLNNHANYMASHFGSVIEGLQTLKDNDEKNCPVKECGLLII